MPNSKHDEQVLAQAKRLWERLSAHEATARYNARADRRFACGDSYNNYQWTDQARAQRGNDRPTLTHNKVRQHNLQIINDARQNKASVKITPVGGNASYEAAEVFEGIIRRIEYQSKAIDAYSTGIYHQVESGLGFVAIETKYVQIDNSFEQEIYIRRIGDPDTVYYDPDCQEYDKSDMNYAFEFRDIPREVWDADHPKHEAPPQTPLGLMNNTWVTRDHVRVATFWRRTEQRDAVLLLKDGRTVRKSDLDDDQRDLLAPLVDRTRDVVDYQVEWYRIEGDEVTDSGIWAGKYIPIIPFLGEETNIDGVLDRKGHTRSQIDAQRVYNYWSSAAVEQVALQSKTPYVASLKAIENLESYWNTANTKNHSVLPYNDTDDQGNKNPPPARQEPPAMASAYVQGMTLARQDLLDVTGQYQAELGMPSNERSGVAIQQRQRQGDTATYHYIDNQAKAIRQVGRILLDLIPKIYDTTRVTRILAQDGSDSQVLIAPGSPQAHMRVAMTQQGPQQVNEQQAEQIDADPALANTMIIFNPQIGAYDVEADVGPSFGTMRQEASNAFSQIMQANPQAFMLVGDLWAKNSDFPGADILADRLERGMPQQYKPGPDPQVQQVTQAAQQMQAQAQQLLQQADAEVASLKAEIVRMQEQAKERNQELAIKDYNAETERLKAVGQIDPMALQLVVRQLLMDMMQTDIIPHLHAHSQLEGQLQTNAQPTPPPEPQAPQQPEQQAA